MVIFGSGGQCSACHAQTDKKGDHAIVCAYQGERISRHNQLRDALFQTAVQASLSPAREERALIPGGEVRPADVFLPSWSNGRDTALDVTVVSPLQQSLVDKATEEKSHALLCPSKKDYTKF